MQLKIMLGKLSLRKPLRLVVEDWMEKNELLILRVQLEHVFKPDTLASHHKDPFDRLRIAQAIAEGLTIITHDQAFALYAIPIIW